MNSAPIRVPLVTGNNDPTTLAALNDVGTTILFGAGSGQSTNFGWFSGGRMSLGAWLDAEQGIGLEGTGLLLENRSILFNAASAGGAAPIVSIPFNATVPFNNNPAGPSAIIAGNAPNNVAVRLTSRLWGAEANGLLNLYRTERFRLTGLIGLRYLDLLENLTLTDSIADPATPGGIVAIVDGFGTRNQFYGAQLGTRAGLTMGRWNVDTTLKVAFGCNHQVLNVAGATTINNGAFGMASGSTPGGVFAEPSNMGQFQRNVFAVVPEVQFKLGYLVTSNIQTFVGYNFLYLSNALRPGNQIDSNLNITQNAFLVPPGTLTGPAAPLPVLRSSGFWAQGINFGMEFKF